MSDSTYTLNYTGAEINSHLGITSKAAASGGTDESLVTTGEKYNWDNKVDGPNSSTNNQIAVFDGTTGKTIKDSGKTISNLTALGLSNATVGQFLTVGSVDANGVPTSWTTVTITNAAGQSF